MPDQWTVVTSDGMPAAHFEHTIVVTSKGVDILTDGRPLGDLVPHVLRTYQHDAREFARRAKPHGP